MRLLQHSELALEPREPSKARDEVGLVCTSGRVAQQDGARALELFLNLEQLALTRLLPQPLLLTLPLDHRLMNALLLPPA
jgi:hypothetical protein